MSLIVMVDMVVLASWIIMFVSIYLELCTFIVTKIGTRIFTLSSPYEVMILEVRWT